MMIRGSSVDLFLEIDHKLLCCDHALDPYKPSSLPVQHNNPVAPHFWFLTNSLQGGNRLVTDTAGLGDDAGHLLDLSLGAAEGAEPLLGELTGTLVLGVAKQLNNAALVGGKAIEGR